LQSPFTRHGFCLASRIQMQKIACKYEGRARQNFLKTQIQDTALHEKKMRDMLVCMIRCDICCDSWAWCAQFGHSRLVGALHSQEKCSERTAYSKSEWILEPGETKVLWPEKWARNLWRHVHNVSGSWD
jgi:hypothetical protein